MLIHKTDLLLTFKQNNDCVVGGGLLVELMKRATQSKQFAELDHAIKTKVIFTSY